MRRTQIELIPARDFDEQTIDPLSTMPGYLVRDLITTIRQEAIKQQKETDELQKALEFEQYAAASNEIHAAFNRLLKLLAFIAGTAGDSGESLRQKLRGKNEQLQAVQAKLIELADLWKPDESAILKLTQVIAAHTDAITAVVNARAGAELKLIEVVRQNSSGLDDLLDSTRDQLLASRRPKGSMATDLRLIAEMGKQLLQQYPGKPASAIVNMISDQLYDELKTSKDRIKKQAYERLTKRWSLSSRGENLLRAIERLDRAEN